VLVSSPKYSSGRVTWTLPTVLCTGMLLRISVGSPSGVNPFTGFIVTP
jgi:hypothetical protein